MIWTYKKNIPWLLEKQNMSEKWRIHSSLNSVTCELQTRGEQWTVINNSYQILLNWWVYGAQCHISWTFMGFFQRAQGIKGRGVCPQIDSAKLLFSCDPALVLSKAKQHQYSTNLLLLIPVLQPTFSELFSISCCSCTQRLFKYLVTGEMKNQKAGRSESGQWRSSWSSASPKAAPKFSISMEYICFGLTISHILLWVDTALPSAVYSYFNILFFTFLLLHLLPHP